MSKTAVLFYGETRGGKENWNRLNELLVKPNNADVFIHTWYYDENYFHHYDSELNESELNEMTIYYKNKGVHYTPPAELFEIFKPVSVMIDKPIYHDEPRLSEIIENFKPKSTDIYCKRFGYDVVMRQYYTRKMVIELRRDYEKKMGFLYDNIILVRLDLNLLQEVKFTEKLSTIKIRQWSKNYMICDQIMAGPSSMIDVIKNMYDNATELHLKYCCPEHHFMQVEYILCIYLLQNQVVLDDYDYPCFWERCTNGLNRFDKDFVEKNDDCKKIER
jgi:hypothetical protein